MLSQYQDMEGIGGRISPAEDLCIYSYYYYIPLIFFSSPLQFSEYSLAQALPETKVRIKACSQEHICDWMNQYLQCRKKKK